LLLSVGLFSLASCDAGASLKKCESLGLSRLERSGVRLFVDSSLREGGELDAGHIATCEDAPEAASTLVAIEQALAEIPSALAPTKVDVHLAVRAPVHAGAVGAIEYHLKSGALLTAERSVRLPKSVWLHELGHLKMGPGPLASASRAGMVGQQERPSELSERLFSAVSEAAADYYAAAISRNPQLGDAQTEHRDLSAPSSVSAPDWAGLALERAFDPHRYAGPLAAAFWRAAPLPGALLEDIVTCFSNSEQARLQPQPRDAVRAFISHCPERSRHTIDGAFRQWLPHALLSKAPPETLP
jgi:hypothetical protein